MATAEQLAAGLALFFWGQLAPLAIEAALVLLAAGLADRLLPRSVWPELRLAAGSVLLLKLVLPAALAPPFALMGQPAGWWPELPAIDTAAHPAWRGLAIATAVGWLAGALACLAIGLWRRRRLARVWRVAAPAGEELERVLLSAAARLGLREAPPLRIAAGLASPCVFGLFRPRILLPPDLDHRMAEHALLHELAHVRRGDLLLAAACGLLRAIYFFHPLVHLAERRLAGLRELCCDRYVARRLGEERVAYRQTLLAFAARRHGVALAALPFAGRSSLLERLRALERAEKDRPLLRRLLTTVAMAGALACAVPLAPPAALGAARVAEMIEKPPGCLQLRFLVMEKMTQELRANQNNENKEPK